MRIWIRLSLIGISFFITVGCAGNSSSNEYPDSSIDTIKKNVGGNGGKTGAGGTVSGQGGATQAVGGASGGTAGSAGVSQGGSGDVVTAGAGGIAGAAGVAGVAGTAGVAGAAGVAGSAGVAGAAGAGAGGVVATGGSGGAGGRDIPNLNPTACDRGWECKESSIVGIPFVCMEPGKSAPPACGTGAAGNGGSGGRTGGGGPFDFPGGPFGIAGMGGPLSIPGVVDPLSLICTTPRFSACTFTFNLDDPLNAFRTGYCLRSCVPRPNR